MKITINIPDKDIKAAIEYRLNGDLFENYDIDILKRAKVPSKTSIIKSLMADEKFIAKLEKEIIRYTEVEEVLYDCIHNVDCPVVEALEERCNDEYSKWCDEWEDEKQALASSVRESQDVEDIKRTIKALEKAGYKIVKA